MFQRTIIISNDGNGYVCDPITAILPLTLSRNMKWVIYHHVAWNPSVKTLQVVLEIDNLLSHTRT